MKILFWGCKWRLNLPSWHYKNKSFSLSLRITGFQWEGGCFRLNIFSYELKALSDHLRFNRLERETVFHEHQFLRLHILSPNIILLPLKRASWTWKLSSSNVSVIIDGISLQRKSSCCCSSKRIPSLSAVQTRAQSTTHTTRPQCDTICWVSFLFGKVFFWRVPFNPKRCIVLSLQRRSLKLIGNVVPRLSDFIKIKSNFFFSVLNLWGIGIHVSMRSLID